MTTPYSNTKALVRIANVEYYCHNCKSARGIWKLIDQNRELLQFLQMYAPEILAKYPCIEGWLGDQDIFLVSLRELLEFSEKPDHMGPNFPRPWPGEYSLDGAYLTTSILQSSINIPPATPKPSPIVKPIGFLSRLKRLFQCGALVLALLAPATARADLLDAPCTKYGVPKALAMAIARQESRFHPWAVNIDGQSYFPASREDALELIARKGRGKSFDVGLMQVNSWWLKRLGISPATALEPHNNATIGVWILAQKIQRHGLNWKAVASYHTPLNRNPERGRRYAASVVRHLKQLTVGECHEYQRKHPPF